MGTQILLTRHDLISSRRSIPMEELDIRDFTTRERGMKSFLQANAIVFLEDDGQTKVLKHGRPSGFQP